MDTKKSRTIYLNAQESILLSVFNAFRSRTYFLRVPPETVF